ncbi:MAG: hypothetical protein VW894_02885 [Gammaproteobacteria bacterium]|jgi:hypothetical protein
MVSVDKVYQRVLAILNKENRGYMTPQEYNLLANQAQLEIFEQYFYDLNQYNRRGEINNEYGNIVKNIKEKIDLFKVENYNLAISSGKYTLPSNLYRLGTVQYNNNEVEGITTNEYVYINKSPLSKPTTTYPVYIRENDAILVYPSTIVDTVVCSYIKKPTEVNWTYFEVNGTALYNAAASDHQNYELHSSEETALVNKILTYAGLVIKQADIVQVADAKENKKITQEKS